MDVLMMLERDHPLATTDPTTNTRTKQSPTDSLSKPQSDKDSRPTDTPCVKDGDASTAQEITSPQNQRDTSLSDLNSPTGTRLMNLVAALYLIKQGQYQH